MKQKTFKLENDLNMRNMKKTIPLSHAVRFIISPLPTSLVTCVGKDGKPNIIAISLLSKCWGMPLKKTHPAFGVYQIMVHPARYSHKLIEETGEFVINIPTADLVRQVWYCGLKSGRVFDKFKETGLTPIPATQVKPPLIAECPINIECKVVEKIKPKYSSYTHFFGKAVAIHVEEDVWDGNILNVDKAPMPLFVPSGKFIESEFRKPGEVILKRKRA
jgi:flavin reductase (DIM6/NTAB) family NADH-FMN oxidoreductase RutF